MSNYLKVNFPALLVLVFLQGGLLLMFYGWYVQTPSRPPSPTVDKKVHVLVLSSWRSGSSFMGQVFGQHPSVFYLMEPAWHVWHSGPTASKHYMKMAVRDLVHRVFHCDFSVMDSYMPASRSSSSLFMWSSSRALCSPPICSLTPLNQFSNPGQCQKKCGSATMETVEEGCKSYSHVVLKEVRFFELESLYPLLKDPTLDLRILHLVRDPRAVLRSKEESSASFGRDNSFVLEQKKVPRNEVEYEAIGEVCRSHMLINEKAVMSPPPFLKGRYKLVRFEDVALNPLEEVKGIYDFVSLEMTPSLENWIYNVTHGKGKGTAFDITSRNAQVVTQAWRKSLSFSKVQKIQEACKDAMSLLGYRTVDSPKEQQNYNIDLLVPRVPYDFNWESLESNKSRS